MKEFVKTRTWWQWLIFIAYIPFIIYVFVYQGLFAGLANLCLFVAAAMIGRATS
jgi:hypothetical protein